MYHRHLKFNSILLSQSNSSKLPYSRHQICQKVNKQKYVKSRMRLARRVAIYRDLLNLNKTYDDCLVACKQAVSRFSSLVARANGK